MRTCTPDGCRVAVNSGGVVLNVMRWNLENLCTPQPAQRAAYEAKLFVPCRV